MAEQARTVIRHRRHYGPLIIQRPYYQEKDRPQVVVIHPPGGVVGGDELRLDIQVTEAAKGLVTTPAATKFYRSQGLKAKQIQSIVLHPQSELEWLPQETLYFDRCLVENNLVFKLENTCVKLIAWDIVGLGRPARGEGFEQGELHQSLEVWVAERLIFLDRLHISPSDDFLHSQSALASYGLLATALFYSEDVASQKQLLGCLQAQTWSNLVGVTQLDHLVVLRVLAEELDEVKTILYEAWQIARPLVIGLPALKPRIWNT